MCHSGPSTWSGTRPAFAVDHTGCNAGSCSDARPSCIVAPAGRENINLIFTTLAVVMQTLSLPLIPIKQDMKDYRIDARYVALDLCRSRRRLKECNKCLSDFPPTLSRLCNSFGVPAACLSSSPGALITGFAS